MVFILYCGRRANSTANDAFNVGCLLSICQHPLIFTICELSIQRQASPIIGQDAAGWQPFTIAVVEEAWETNVVKGQVNSPSRTLTTTLSPISIPSFLSNPPSCRYTLFFFQLPSSRHCLICHDGTTPSHHFQDARTRPYLALPLDRRRCSSSLPPRGYEPCAQGLSQQCRIYRSRAGMARGRRPGQRTL